MTRLTRLIRHLGQLTCTLLTLSGDGVRYGVLRLRSPAALAAENLFLRTQLALSQERHLTPKRATPATHMALVWRGRWFDGRHVLAIVQPATFLRWHRHGFRLLWRWTSRPGRPPLPAKLHVLIRRMARDNPSWDEERIANELLLRLGLRVSPRTVRKDMPKRFDRGRNYGIPSQRQSHCRR
jgi:putative transposase